ncbi:MAG: hypothetical protein WCK60_02915 [Candidatus Nomurabacteria bacterium]
MSVETVKNEYLVHLDVDNLATNRSLAEIIYKMSDDQKQVFGVWLLHTIEYLNYPGEEEKENKEKLVALFGKEILNIASFNHPRFFFSLTEKGTEFRAWYGAFNSVSDDQFDSFGGSGLAFSATCDNPQVLRKWITPFIAKKTKWGSNGLGSLWIASDRWSRLR